MPTLLIILLRKSFFSGHASFSMYTMLYLVVSCEHFEFIIYIPPS